MYVFKFHQVSVYTSENQNFISLTQSTIEFDKYYHNILQVLYNRNYYSLKIDRRSNI